MVVKLEHPEDILREARILQEKRLKDFHKVSESGLMDDYYRESALLSRIREFAKNAKGEVHVLDAASGSGRQGYFIMKVVGEENSKKVIIHDEDKDRRELGKGREEDMIIADIMHLAHPDRRMDFVYMNNIPAPLSEVMDYIVNEWRGSRDAKDSMLEMLNLAVDAEFKLILLEGARVTKDGGIIMFGGKEVGQSEEYVRINLKDMPFKVDKFKVVELENMVVPLWRKYGKDIEKPTFMLMRLEKTGGNLQELVDLEEQVRYTALEQLNRIEGSKDDRSMFEEVLEEMRKAKRRE